VLSVSPDELLVTGWQSRRLTTAIPAFSDQRGQRGCFPVLRLEFSSAILHGMGQTGIRDESA